jgi:hypothetical protein
MVALGVTLVGVGILGGAALFNHVNHQVQVLMVTSEVPAGSVLTSSDLGSVAVSAASPVHLVPARQEGQVVGLVASTDLQPGSLLAASDLTTSIPPVTGQVLVPVAMKPSQLPASGLSGGNRVLVVWAPGAQANASSAATPGRNFYATVEAVQSVPDQDGDEVVDLLVPDPDGIPLAKEAATGNIAFVVTSRKA